eukprot:9553880-Lingulodinium_polyedra.AAC.1
MVCATRAICEPLRPRTADSTALRGMNWHIMNCYWHSHGIGMAWRWSCMAWVGLAWHGLALHGMNWHCMA